MRGRGEREKKPSLALLLLAGRTLLHLTRAASPHPKGWGSSACFSTGPKAGAPESIKDT